MLTLATMTTAVRMIPLEEIGLRLTLGPGQVAWILLTTLPLALLAGSFQLTVASFAHSFKEAQTYLSLTLFLPMLPGMIMSFNPVKTQDWMMLVPMLSQQMLVGDMLRGDPISLGSSAVAAAATLVATGVFLGLTVALFERETIVFGK
jgi:sodium transport system permease protein